MALICPPPHVGGYGILGSYFHGSNFNLLFSHFVLRDNWSRRCAKPFTHFSRCGSNGLSLGEWPPRRHPGVIREHELLEQIALARYGKLNAQIIHVGDRHLTVLAAMEHDDWHCDLG